MENWSLNNLFIETVNLKSEEDIISSLSIPVQKRSHFWSDNKTITIPRFFYRFIGVDGDETEYYNNLYELDKTLKSLDRLYLSVKNGFEKDFSKNFLDNLNMVWNKLLSMSDFDGETVASLLRNSDILSVFPNEILENQKYENLASLIEYYFESVQGEVEEEYFKNLLYSFIYWIEKYFYNLFIDFDYLNLNPKILYYGNISKEEIYFLIYLASLGCDVLFFNTLSDCSFSEIDKDNLFSVKKDLIRKINIKPFPDQIKKGRSLTAAFIKSEEQLRVFNSNDSRVYRPWQFAEYHLEAVTLKTTYEEIHYQGLEMAMVRHNWEVSDNTVYLPNIFCKVGGVHKDLDKYWSDISKLVDLEESLFIRNLPIVNDVNFIEFKNKFDEIFHNGIFDEKKLLNATWWPYKSYNLNVQKLLSNKIIELCNETKINNPKIKELIDYYKLFVQEEEKKWGANCIHSASLEFYEEEKKKIEDTYSNSYLIKLSIFGTLLSIDDIYIKKIQSFDYPYNVPKLIIYNNEYNGDLSYFDCILLLFLNSLGFDIMVFNPSGNCDIENYIDKDFYDIHMLEKIEFQLEFKRKRKFSFKDIFK